MSDLPAWLGANFWSRAGGPRMWSRYDGVVVRSELEVLARHGLGVTRSFCFWPDFVPEPEVLDETVAGHFADFLDAHVEAGLGTIPTLVVGHMSGENWDPPWRGGRDLYRDVWLVGQQAWLAQELAARFAPAPGRRRLAALERDAALRRPGADGRDHGLGTDPRPGAPGRRRTPAGLGRRRRVGHRGLRGRQRLLAALACAARRLRGAARVPDAGRRAPSGARRRLRVRARRRLRQAGGARGVRRHVGLRGGRSRRRLLPPGAPHDAPRGGDRLARLEQLRLRRPRRRGSLPAPPVRDALRPHRPRGPAEAAAPGDGGVRRAARGARRRGLRARQGRRGARRARALRAGAALHDPGVPRRPPRRAVPVVRRGARGGPSRRRRPRARRDPRDGAPLPGALHEAPHRPGPRAPAPARRPAARRSTSRTSRARRPTSAGRGSHGSTSCSASGTGSATASPTRSRTTSSSSSSSRGSAGSRRARG